MKFYLNPLIVIFTYTVYIYVLYFVFGNIFFLFTDLEKRKIIFEKDQSEVEKDKKYFMDLAEEEEKKSNDNEAELKEFVFGFFRNLITNKKYLSICSFVEDAYQYIVDPSDNNLDLVTMLRQIELTHENLLLDLDLLPNDIVVKSIKKFYKEEKIERAEAKEAQKKVNFEKLTPCILYVHS